MPAAYCRSHEGSVNLPRLVEALGPQVQPLVWLDSARHHPVTGQFSIVAWDPWLSLSASGATLTVRTSTSTTDLLGNPLEQLQRVLGRYPGLAHPADLPVAPGVLGYVSYELNGGIKRRPDPKPLEPSVPELLLFGMQQLVIVDHVHDRSWCVGVVDPHRPGSQAMREAQRRLEALDALLSTGEAAATVQKAVSLPAPAKTS